jgi:hypothetical protein
LSRGRLIGIESAEHVAGTSSRVQEWDRARSVDLLSQAVYVDFNQIRKRIELLVPNMFSDFSSADDSPGVTGQKFE